LRVWGRYLAGRYHQMRGRLVIFDRYTYDALLPPPGQLDWRNRLYYSLLGHACPAPDLVILLDAPGSLMYRRKHEHNPAELEIQRQRFLALRGRVPHLEVVDASAPADRVRDEVLARMGRRAQAKQRRGRS
jgi:thymidylate kinase